MRDLESSAPARSPPRGDTYRIAGRFALHAAKTLGELIRAFTAQSGLAEQTLTAAETHVFS